MEKRNHRIGIVGGMGPMAGVLLQKLIIEATPAERDQDHLEVLCYTNPHIPDRTRSLQEDDGKSYVEAVIDSIKVLELAGVDLILIPCNTSHARFDMIQTAVNTLILHMPNIVLNKLKGKNIVRAGLLATDGTIASGIFAPDDALELITPGVELQKEVMDIIYDIKAGKYNDQNIMLRIRKVIRNLCDVGAEKIILGCTELSLYGSSLSEEAIIDPLFEVAKEAVRLSLEANRITSMYARIPSL